MLFTIAIPTYNNRKTISRAIQSALNQTYKGDYEVLVVNNASTDGTLEEILLFQDNKIRVVTNPQTVDMYSNHNICLKEAKGDYVLFCHSDDILTKDALLLLGKRIEERQFPSKYILWGHSMFRDFQAALDRGHQKINTMFSGEFSIHSFIWGGLTPSGTCYSRESLLEIGGFPAIGSKVPMADWAILVIAAYNHFEFEMIDRLLFIREFASTANDLNASVWQENTIASLDAIEKSLNKNQFSNFLAIVKERNEGLFFWYKKYMSVEELKQKAEFDKKEKRRNRIKRLLHFLLRF